MISDNTSVYIVYRTSDNYDGEDNVCGTAFCLIGIFTDPQKAKDAASRHEGEIEIKLLNEEDPEYYT